MVCSNLSMFYFLRNSPESFQTDIVQSGSKMEKRNEPMFMAGLLVREKDILDCSEETANQETSPIKTGSFVLPSHGYWL